MKTEMQVFEERLKEYAKLLKLSESVISAMEQDNRMLVLRVRALENFIRAHNLHPHPPDALLFPQLSWTQTPSSQNVSSTSNA